MTRKPDLYDISSLFNKRHQEIVAFHRVVLRGVPLAFQDAWDNVIEHTDLPYDADYGDVDAAVHDLLPTTDQEISRHLGNMALQRAISLAEHTLEQITVAVLRADRLVIDSGGKSWKRLHLINFFKTALATSFDLDQHGLRSLEELRDYYVHAYGAFPEGEATEQLRKRVLALAGSTSPTPEEGNLGYKEAVSITMAGDGWDGFAPTVVLSNLATYRLLEAIRVLVDNAIVAATDGLLPCDELEASKFAKDWSKDYLRSGKKQSATAAD